MFKKIIPIFVAAIIYSLMIFGGGSGCSDDGNPAEMVQDVILSDSVVVIDTTELSGPVIEGNDYIFTFTGIQPDIYDGNLIVGHTGGGYLREVVRASVIGNRITLRTVQATLTDVVEQGEFQTTVQLNIRENGDIQPTFLAEGVTVSDGGLILDDFKLFSGLAGEEALYITVTQGSIGFEPSIGINWKINQSTLQELQVIADGELSFICDLEIVCSGAVSHTGEIRIAEFSYPFSTQMGPLPVVGEIKLRFMAGFETDLVIPETIINGIESEAVISAGAKYEEQNWIAIWEKDVTQNIREFEWGKVDSAAFIGYVRPEINVKLYTVNGPDIEVESYLEFDARVVLSNWEWMLSGGLNGSLDFQSEIFSSDLDDFNAILENWEQIIDSISGEINHPPFPPKNPNPPDNTDGVPIDTDLSWDCNDFDDDPLTYDIYFGDSPQPPLVIGNHAATTFDPGTLEYGTMYFWDVIAKDDHGDQTNSPHWSFKTIASEPPGPPTLSFPTDGSTDQQRTLIWNSVEDATDYHLQVAIDPGFSEPVFDETGIRNTTHRVEVLIYSTTYYWRVRAHNTAGFSDWSAVWSFTTEAIPLPGRPYLISPPNRVEELGIHTLLYSWSSVEYAADYHLQESLDNAFTPNHITFERADIADTLLLRQDLTGGRRYYWRVRGHNDSGFGEWTASWYFDTMMPPLTPPLSSPPDRTTNLPLDMIILWEYVERVDWFTYEVRLTPVYADPPVYEGVTHHTSANLPDLEPSTTYYWRVRAEGRGGVSPWSSMWSFTTGRE